MPWNKKAKEMESMREISPAVTDFEDEGGYEAENADNLQKLRTTPSGDSLQGNGGFSLTTTCS